MQQKKEKVNGLQTMERGDKSSNITFEIDIALIHSNPNLAPL